jgi:ankyrin repeat protein
VELLLGAGADPHIKSRAGKTPLDLAKDRGLTNIQAVLVAAMEKAAKGEL